MVDDSEYKQYCYVKPSQKSELNGILGINNIEEVDIYDVIKDEETRRKRNPI